MHKIKEKKKFFFFFSHNRHFSYGDNFYSQDQRFYGIATM
jgi:hypothetical protein